MNKKFSGAGKRQEDLGRKGILLLRRLEEPERRRGILLLGYLLRRGRSRRRRLEARPAGSEWLREEPGARGSTNGAEAEGRRRESGVEGQSGGRGGRHGRTRGREAECEVD